MNHSKQKEALRKLIDQQKIKHLSALEVFDLLRATNPKIAIATVYRNLNLFVKKGLLMKIETSGTEAYYDSTTSNHAHLVCTQCGKIEDIDFTMPDWLVAEVQNRNFKFKNLDLSIKGLCKDCLQEKGKNASKDSNNGISARKTAKPKPKRVL